MLGNLQPYQQILARSDWHQCIISNQNIAIASTDQRPTIFIAASLHYNRNKDFCVLRKNNRAGDTTSQFMFCTHVLRPVRVTCFQRETSCRDWRHLIHFSVVVHHLIDECRERSKGNTAGTHGFGSGAASQHTPSSTASIHSVVDVMLGSDLHKKQPSSAQLNYQAVHLTLTHLTHLESI